LCQVRTRPYLTGKGSTQKGEKTGLHSLPRRMGKQREIKESTQKNFLNNKRKGGNKKRNSPYEL